MKVPTTTLVALALALFAAGPVLADDWLGYPFKNPQLDGVEVMGLGAKGDTLLYRVRRKSVDYSGDAAGEASFKVFEVDLSTGTSKEIFSCSISLPRDPDSGDVKKMPFTRCPSSKGPPKATTKLLSPALVVVNNHHKVKGYGTTKRRSSAKVGERTLTVWLGARIEPIEGEPDWEAGDDVTLAYDHLARLRLPLTEMGVFGWPSTRTSAYCVDKGCLLFTLKHTPTMRGPQRWVTVTPLTPFSNPSLADDGAEKLCQGGTSVSIVANRDLLHGPAKALAALLKKRGCAVIGPKAAKKERKRSAIYTKPLQGKEAAIWKLGHALNATTEPLTWKSNASVVIAVAE